MTKWEKLFGTPERTVRTIIDGCCCDCYACSMPVDCPCFGKYRVLDDDAEKLLVWLESEVEPKEDGDDHKTLKTCPFCGGEARVSEKSTLSVYWIYCMDCGAASMFMKTEAEAIAAWNARVERTCKNISKEWTKTSFAGAETSFCCSECGAHYVDCESYYAGLADADEEQIRTNFCPNCGAKVVDE